MVNDVVKDGLLLVAMAWGAALLVQSIQLNMEIHKASKREKRHLLKCRYGMTYIPPHDIRLKKVYIGKGKNKRKWWWNKSHG